MSESVKLGIKKALDFDRNIEAVRKAVSTYGPEAVIDRLKEARQLFYWIKNDPNWQEQIDHLVGQIEFDNFVAPFLTEEIEFSQFVAENGIFKTVRKKIKVLIDPISGKPANDFEELLY